MADAILRTLTRLFITRRNLLEWMTAAHARSAVDLKMSSMYKRMAGGMVLAGGACVVLVHGRGQAWAVAAPFLLLWFAAPAVARWISLPPRLLGVEPVSPADLQALRLTARRTWCFFEVFISPADHALPPDNFQEDPKTIVAHGTSPTDIGLYLLSTLAARDLRWLGAVETVERLETTLETMSRLELFRGHFYNWYDTRELHPLEQKITPTVQVFLQIYYGLYNTTMCNSCSLSRILNPRMQGAGKSR